MAELDLTKAKARAVEEAIGYVGECICDEAWTSRNLVDPTCGWHLIEGLAEDIVNAALPHILEAFAAKAAAEACTPHSYNDAVQKVATGIWLRDLAAELPHG